jgi:GNAT superfamily N-acetyltransferase
MRKLAYLREEHLWYQCELGESRPRRDMPEGVRLVRAEASEVGALARLGRDPEEARECLAGGNDVWLALDGEEPLFACFTFRHATPVAAASAGTLPLPPGTACLEDSVTSAAARGRGIAPAAWTLIGDELARSGFTTLVTKIETTNEPSRRAVEKVGYRPVAVMRYMRVGSRRRTAVRALGGLGDELATRLA